MGSLSVYGYDQSSLSFTVPTSTPCLHPLKICIINKQYNEHAHIATFSTIIILYSRVGEGPPLMEREGHTRTKPGVFYTSPFRNDLAKRHGGSRSQTILGRQGTPARKVHDLRACMVYATSTSKIVRGNLVFGGIGRGLAEGMEGCTGVHARRSVSA